MNEIMFSTQNSLFVHENELKNIYELSKEKIKERLISNEIETFFPNISGQIILILEDSWFSAKVVKLIFLKIAFPNDHPISIKSFLFKEIENIKCIGKDEFNTIFLVYNIFEESFVFLEKAKKKFQEIKEFYEIQAFEIIKTIEENFPSLIRKIIFLAEKTSITNPQNFWKKIIKYGELRSCDYKFHNTKNSFNGTELRIVEECQIFAPNISDLSFHLTKTHYIDFASYSLDSVNDWFYELIYIDQNNEKEICITKVINQRKEEIKRFFKKNGLLLNKIKEFLDKSNINKIENSLIYTQINMEDIKILNPKTIELKLIKKIEKMSYTMLVCFLKALCEKCYSFSEKNKKYVRNPNKRFRIAQKNNLLFPSDFAFKYYCGDIQFFPSPLGSNYECDINSFLGIVKSFNQESEDHKFNKFYETFLLEIKTLKDFFTKIGAKIKPFSHIKDETMLYCRRCKKFSRGKHCKDNDDFIQISSDLFEIFEFHRFLGQGGEASVFHVSYGDGENYAIKIKTFDDDQIDHEIEALNYLKEFQSEGIVKYYDSECAVIVENKENKINLAILLELCDTSLDKILKKNNLSQKQFISYCKQICEAIRTLHYPPEGKKPIIHRDLKPNNILLKQDIIKLTDFGIAKIKKKTNINSNSQISQRSGTQGYVAPEIDALDNFEINGKVDIFSLGVIFNKMKNQLIDKLEIQNFSIISDIAKDCKEFDPERRPDIKEIIKKLEGLSI